MESKHKLFGKFCHRTKWENSSNIQKAHRLTFKKTHVLWGPHFKVRKLFLQETCRLTFKNPPVLQVLHTRRRTPSMTTTMGIMQRVSSCLTGFRVLSCGLIGFEVCHRGLVVCMMSTDILFMMKMMSKSVRGDCGDVAAMIIRGTVCLSHFFSFN